MKKMVFAISALTLVFTATGCGGKKVVCTSTIKEDGMEMKAKITATLKDDKVDSVSETLTFNSKEEADKYCSMLSLLSGLSEDGTKIDYTCKGKNITIKNAEQLSEENGNYKGLTKKEFIEKMEKSASDEDAKVTCK